MHVSLNFNFYPTPSISPFSSSPLLQLTIDTIGYPGNRFHLEDYVEMSQAVDFQFLMDYDMTGRAGSGAHHIAWANSPYTTVTNGECELMLAQHQ